MRYPEDFDGLVIQDAEEFRRLAARVQVGYCIHQLETEVSSGGFHQFFTNPSGAFTRETLKALTAVGATATRALLERAIAIAYPEGFPADASDHQDALADYADVPAAFEAVDSAFWRHDEPLEELVSHYLARTAQPR
jgi:Domain of unknown function (DUF4375)